MAWRNFVLNLKTFSPSSPVKASGNTTFSRAKLLLVIEYKPLDLSSISKFLMASEIASTQDLTVVFISSNSPVLISRPILSSSMSSLFFTNSSIKLSNFFDLWRNSRISLSVVLELTARSIAFFLPSSAFSFTLSILFWSLSTLTLDLASSTSKVPVLVAFAAMRLVIFSLTSFSFFFIALVASSISLLTKAILSSSVLSRQSSTTSTSSM